MELNTRLISLQPGDYTQIIVEGAPPNWTDVIDVFASYTAGAQNGGGAAAQHHYCRQISWGEAQPGDLVFYPDDSHVGIVGLQDVTGNLLIIHCASGSSNNVVITDSSGFMTIGRPLYYGK